MSTPRNITHLAETDIQNNRIYHVTNTDVQLLSTVTDSLTEVESQLSESTPTSGTLFAFGSGGYLSVTEDGKNLVYINIDGSSAQITNFS